MTTTESTLSIDNQNEMMDQSEHDAGIHCRQTNDIERMQYRLIKEHSAPEVGIEEFDGSLLNFNYFRSMFCETG